MKRFVSLVLALILVAPVFLSVIPTAQAAEFTSIKVSDGGYSDNEDFRAYDISGYNVWRRYQGSGTIYQYTREFSETVTAEQTGYNLFGYFSPTASGMNQTSSTLFYVRDILDDYGANIALSMSYYFTASGSGSIGSSSDYITLLYYDANGDQIGYSKRTLGQVGTTKVTDSYLVSTTDYTCVPSNTYYISGFICHFLYIKKPVLSSVSFKVAVNPESLTLLVRPGDYSDAEEADPTTPSTEATEPEADETEPPTEVTVDLSGVESRLDGVESSISDMQIGMNAGFADINSNLDSGFADVNDSIDTMSGEINSGLDDVQGEVEKSNGFLGGILDGILELPQKLLDGIKGLFVPDAEAMQEYSEKWQTLLSERFGVIYQCIDIIDLYAETFTQREEQNTVEFPAVTVDLAGVPFTFGGWTVRLVPEGFEFITDAIKLVVNFIALGLFLNTMRKKYDNLMGGQ